MSKVLLKVSHVCSAKEEQSRPPFRLWDITQCCPQGALKGRTASVAFLPCLAALASPSKV